MTRVMDQGRLKARWTHAVRRDGRHDRALACGVMGMIGAGVMATFVPGRTPPLSVPVMQGGIVVRMIPSMAVSMPQPVVPPPVLSAMPPVVPLRVAVPVLRLHPVPSRAAAARVIPRPMSGPVGRAHPATGSDAAWNTTPAEIPKAASGVPGEGAGSQDAGWQDAVMARLLRYRIYPDAAREAGEVGTVTIRLVLDRGGNVISAGVAGPSGEDALDAEAVALARRAAPYPKPPASVPGAAIVLMVPVSFDMAPS